MNIIKTDIEGLLIIEPKIFNDERGYFYESFNANTFREKTGLDINFVQDNQAKSVKNVLRGLHFQNYPAAQSKLLRVLSGTIWDVAVDIRKNSPTYGKWYGIELSSENQLQFFVPKGFAHGYSVLSDTAVVFYKCDEFYNKETEGGLMFNDPDVGIDWKVTAGEEIISEKDWKQSSLKDLKTSF